MTDTQRDLALLGLIFGAIGLICFVGFLISRNRKQPMQAFDTFDTAFFLAHSADIAAAIRKAIVDGELNLWDSVNRAHAKVLAAKQPRKAGKFAPRTLPYIEGVGWDEFRDSQPGTAGTAARSKGGRYSVLNSQVGGPGRI